MVTCITCSAHFIVLGLTIVITFGEEDKEINTDVRKRDREINTDIAEAFCKMRLQDKWQTDPIAAAGRKTFVT